MTPEKKLKTIKSYTKRSGHFTTGQKRALETLWPIYGLSEENLQSLDVFPEIKPLIVEIGFGAGDSLVLQAQHQPEFNFIGFDVHQPGIGRILNLMDEAQVKNLKVINSDATVVLSNPFFFNQISKVQIYFPDPWPKARHHKRRLINFEFVKLLSDILIPGGEVHLATDWEDYAIWMKAHFKGDHVLFLETPPEKSLYFFPRATTRFENRGKLRGHSIYEFIYKKI